jgi:homospermidine synthase
MSTEPVKYATFTKKLWIIGFGAIACGTIPLLFKHFNIKKEQIIVIAKDPDASGCAKEYDLEYRTVEILPDNYKEIIALEEGDFVLNLSVDVGCIDLMLWCSDKNALYMDTAVELWEGGFLDENQTTSQRSLYYTRQECLSVREYQQQIGKFPTIISSHGANPGIVSHFAKCAILNIAKDTGVLKKKPTTRQEWAELSRELGVKTIHIAERDTQISHTPRPMGQIQSTWSVDGYYCESIQPSELGWGTHERQFPKDGHRHDFGDVGIYLDNQSHSVRVRSWTPSLGSYQGYLITHNEAITISDYLTVKNDKGNVMCRPTDLL